MSEIITRNVHLVTLEVVTFGHRGGQRQHCVKGSGGKWMRPSGHGGSMRLLRACVC